MEMGICFWDCTFPPFIMFERSPSSCPSWCVIVASGPVVCYVWLRGLSTAGERDPWSRLLVPIRLRMRRTWLLRLGVILGCGRMVGWSLIPLRALRLLVLGCIFLPLSLLCTVLLGRRLRNMEMLGWRGVVHSMTEIQNLHQHLLGERLSSTTRVLGRPSVREVLERPLVQNPVPRPSAGHQ